MYFRQIAERTGSALAYLLGDLAAGQSVVIDPPPGEHVLLRAMLAERGLQLVWVLHTHGGTASDADDYAAFCRQTGAMRAGGASESAPAYRHVGDGDAVAFGDEVVHVIETPGQWPDGVSYLWRDRLFCGDALVLGGTGASRDGLVDADQLYDSVTEKLFTLRDETLVFPGHRVRGRTVSTIAEERRGNRQFAVPGRDAFVAGWRARGRRGVRAGTTTLARPERVELPGGRKDE